MSRPTDREMSPLVDRAPIGMCRITREGRFAYANAALGRLLGYTVDELGALDVDRAVFANPDDRARVVEACRRGEPTCAVRWCARDGRRIELELHGSVTEDGGLDASVLELGGADQRVAEHARTIQLLDTVVRQIPAIYWVLDRELRILRSGGTIAEMLGLTPGQYHGLTLQEMQERDPSSNDPVDSARRALAGEVVSIESEFRGRHLATTVSPHRVGDEIRGVIGTCVDVTAARALERRLAEARRAETERTAEILDYVVRQIPAIYWIVDAELRIVRSGGAAAEIVGYASGTYLGKRLDEVRRRDPPAVDPVENHERALAGETVRYETEYRGRQLAITLSPHQLDGARAVIGTCIDVTASRALERRMVDAQRAESLGVLAGGLAHDFNNLLVAILGNVDLGLREVQSHAPGYTALENIRHAGLRAAELTNQLLAYAGRGGVSTSRVIASPVVHELLRISRPTFPETLRFEVGLPEALAVRGDAAQFRQVLMNLINNARDAIGHNPGTIAIRGELVRHRGEPAPDDIVTAPPGNYALIEIADDGTGIDRDTRRRIFEPFFTTKPTGHGLGLAAVLGIVRSHGGGMRLISSPGAGARFQVLWPATTTPVSQPVVTPPTERTILVVDDEDLVRDVVARMVQDLGYATVTASDGKRALELVDEHAIDAVLVDLTMPRMSGADVIIALRAKRPEIRIVLCTGYDRDRKGPVDADAYLAKPFRLEALEQTLAKLLG
ncbi:MAG TPA: PAS domain S-box protein [Kofleriaceae bacterium]|nr:PAS domain S-box protein [Kofleriaceae bacterium]